jgi:Flp pilus assembly protein TadD
MRYRSNALLPLCLLAYVALLAGCVQPQSAPQASASGPDTLNVADAAIAGGDPNMALSVTQSVLQSDPNNVDALIHEGDAYYALNRCPSAEAAYQLALQGDPKSTAAETGLGRCLLKTDPRAAEAALLMAVHDDPGNAAAYNDLGIARDLQSNFAGAADAYQHSLTADPTQTSTEVNLGLSLALSGDGADALQYLGPLATGQDATPKIREDYAAALVATGRLDEARQVLNIDLPPGQVDSAIEGFQEVIASAQPPLPSQDGQVAPPPTMPAVQTAPVAAVPLAVAPASTTTAMTVPATAPMPSAPALSYTPDNSTAAYTGPSPIPVTASSSDVGPGSDATPAVSASIPAQTASATVVKAPTQIDQDTSGSGSITVQLAALNSQTDAEREWTKISSSMPSLFSDKQPEILNAVVNGKTFYRLRTGSFSSEAEAEKFCGQVSAAGDSCEVAHF